MRVLSVLEEMGAVRGESPRELIDTTVDALRVAAEADVALFYTSALVDTETLRAVDWSVAGRGQRAADVRESFERGFTASSTTAMGPRSWELFDARAVGGLRALVEPIGGRLVTADRQRIA